MSTPADRPLACHVPVLAEAVAEWFTPSNDGVVVDLTVGQAGHSLILGSRLGPDGLLIGIDLDEDALAIARQRLGSLGCKVVLVRSNFASIGQILADQGIEKVDVMLADLGVSSAQLEDAKRGFGFQVDSKLDMRFDTRIQTTAADIVNNADEKDLAELIFRYGQERLSRRIARLIVERRKVKPITSTAELAGLVCRAYGGRGWHRIHPATRTFQALRIAVNAELDNLQSLLGQAQAVLKPAGRFGVISFHSLEDRLVKEDFRAKAKQGIYRILTKRPIRPSQDQVEANRRSRSARLRIVERI